MENPIKKPTRPALYDANGNPNFPWYVHFRITNPETSAFERIKLYKGLGKDQPVAKRYEHAEKMIAVYSKRLAEGWNPFTDPESFYFKKVPLNHHKSKIAIAAIFNNLVENPAIHLRYKSKATYKSVLKNFILWLEKSGHDLLPVSAFEKKHAEAFLTYLTENKKLSNTSRNKHLAILKPFFEVFLQEKRTKENPFSRVIKLREFRQGKLAFKKFQVDLLRDLFKNENPQLWLFCQFQYYCFIRPGELRNLKIENIDFDQALINIPGLISKNKKSQWVVIPEPFYKTIIGHGLQNYAPDLFVFTPFSCPGSIQVPRDYFNKIHAKLLRRVGMDKRHSLYSWKHTGNVMAARSGINIKELQMQNRHADLATFDIYLRSMGVEDMTMIREQFPGI